MSEVKLTAKDRSKAILEWLHVPLTTHRLRGIETDIKAAEARAREEGFLMGRQDEMARAELLVKHARKDVREQALEDAKYLVRALTRRCINTSQIEAMHAYSQAIEALKRAPSECLCGSPLNHVHGCPGYVSPSDGRVK